MFDWVNQYSAALNVFLYAGMCLIWLVYLQLLLMSYIRQKRSSILITRSAGVGTDSHCLITNMGAETIYIHTIIATMKTHDGREIKVAVTERGDITGEDVNELAEASNQGPLKSGEFLDGGTYKNLVKRGLREKQEEGNDQAIKYEDVRVLDMMVVAAYGAEPHSVAATRGFRIDEKGNLSPCSVSTRQIRSRRKRKELDRYLQNYL